MTAPSWGKEAAPGIRLGLEFQASSSPPGAPVLGKGNRDAVVQEVTGRIPSFTPLWTNRKAGDPGDSLIKLFSEEMEPVLQRLNQLPAKSYVEFLRAAGVQPLPPTPAKALLQFTVADAATQSIPIAQGFQVKAPPAVGGDLVTFETNSDLYAAPGAIKELYAFERGVYRTIDASKTDVPFQPFGAKPRPGSAFFIGISANPSVTLGPQISIGIQVQSPPGQRPPVSTGGVFPLPTPLAPLLQWNVLDWVSFEPLQVVSDETAGLLRSGVITLNLPEQWRFGIPQGSPDTAPLLWLCLQITNGVYQQAPSLLAVQLNMVRATAAQTFRDEVLRPVPSSGGSVMSLSQTPVLPGSLQLGVKETADLTFAPGRNTDVPKIDIWQEVDDLSEFHEEDRVYTLDSIAGEVHFGDGVHGKAVPPGFRNVVAQSYQVGGGAAGAVAANKITNMVLSIPFVSGVTNPWPATGGEDAETQAEARLRGPSEIRSRGRAVAPADYEILALRVTGAQVSRAHAVSGFHPSFAGSAIPGVVCVFVVSNKRGPGPPIPDEDTLRAVSEALSNTLSPAGVEIVAAAPAFHNIRIEATVVLKRSVNRGEAVRDVLAELNSYLDPIKGGDDGQGWPFGGTLFHSAFVRRLLSKVSSVSAVPRLSFVVDGARRATCVDFPIPANSLVWPANHQVLALGPEEQS